jgi:hypothetical protein
MEWALSPTHLKYAYDTLAGVAGASGFIHSESKYTTELNVYLKKRCAPSVIITLSSQPNIKDGLLLAGLWPSFDRGENFPNAAQVRIRP